MRVRNLQKAAQLIVEKHAASFQKSLRRFWHCRVLDVTRRARFAASRSINPCRLLDGNVIRVFDTDFCDRGKPKRESDERAAVAIGGGISESREERKGGEGKVAFENFAFFARKQFLFALKSIVDGTRRADLHAAQSAMFDLSGTKTLHRVQRKSHGRVAQPWLNAKPRRREHLLRL